MIHWGLYGWGRIQDMICFVSSFINLALSDWLLDDYQLTIHGTTFPGPGQPQAFRRVQEDLALPLQGAALPCKGLAPGPPHRR